MINTYEKLITNAHVEEIIIDENATLLEDEDGYYAETTLGNVILLNKNLETTIERKCTLVEELGHHYTSYGNITDLSKVENRKQELKARRWGYERLVPLGKLIEAYKYGCRNRYEISNYIEVTEQFLEETILHYSHKYGICVEIDKYVIYFNPLGVMEKY